MIFFEYPKDFSEEEFAEEEIFESHEVEVKEAVENRKLTRAEKELF